MSSIPTPRLLTPFSLSDIRSIASRIIATIDQYDPPKSATRPKKKARVSAPRVARKPPAPPELARDELRSLIMALLKRAPSKGLTLDQLAHETKTRREQVSEQLKYLREQKRAHSRGNTRRAAWFVA